MSNELLQNEKSPRRPWIALALLIFVQAALGAAFNPLKYAPNAYGYFIMGIILSQPILFAIWAALAPQRFINRFLWTFLLCAVVAISVELGSWRHSTPEHGILLFQATLFYLLTVPLLLLLRKLFGWQMEDSRHPMADASYRKYQYGIKHLLFLTITTAVILSGYKSMIAVYPDLHFLPRIPLPQSVGVLCILLSCLLSSLVISLFTLAFSRPLIRITCLTLILSALVNYISYSLIQTTNPNVAFANRDCFLMFQFGVVLSCFISALVIRSCGFKLVRRATSAHRDSH